MPTAPTLDMMPFDAIAKAEALAKEVEAAIEYAEYLKGVILEQIEIAKGDLREALAQAKAIAEAKLAEIYAELSAEAQKIYEEVTARVFGRELYEDSHVKECIQDYFKRMRSKEVTSNDTSTFWMQSSGQLSV